MVLKCVLGVVARLKSCRKKSQVFTLIGLHPKRLNASADASTRRYQYILSRKPQVKTAVAAF